jgi:NTP pyrophosphatase (non-canonical NTP hydrolase)
MKINVTEQTSTFAVPLNKLKGHLMDNMNLKWETSHGKFYIDMQTIQWIMDNAKVSMYNENRSYIYNKAFAEYFKTNSIDIPDYNKTQMMFNRIRTWAETRGLYEKGDPMVQYVKLQEEAGELAKALLKDDQPEVIDAIGDMVVVLTNLAHQRGVYIETCIQTAYDVINQRTGKMINGTFVKDED